jgi:hypothetical protein
MTGGIQKSACHIRNEISYYVDTRYHLWYNEKIVMATGKFSGEDFPVVDTRRGFRAD